MHPLSRRFRGDGLCTISQGVSAETPPRVCRTSAGHLPTAYLRLPDAQPDAMELGFRCVRTYLVFSQLCGGGVPGCQDGGDL